jgi:hypothetical protein
VTYRQEPASPPAVDMRQHYRSPHAVTSGQLQYEGRAKGRAYTCSVHDRELETFQPIRRRQTFRAGYISPRVG